MLPKVCSCDCPECIESGGAPFLNVLNVCFEGESSVICHTKDFSGRGVWHRYSVEGNVGCVSVFMFATCNKCSCGFGWSNR